MDRKEEFLKPGERLDDLQNGYWMIQNPSLFCYGIDAVLLACLLMLVAPAQAQRFFNLTSSEVRVDSVLPRFAQIP